MTSPSRAHGGPLQREWFILDGVTYVGPISQVLLCEQLEGGAVPPHALLWRMGLHDWQPVGSFPEFQGFIENLPRGQSSILSEQNEFAGLPTLPPSDESVSSFAAGGEMLPGLARVATPQTMRTNENAWENFREEQGLPLLNLSEPKTPTNNSTTERLRILKAAGLLSLAVIAVIAAIAWLNSEPPILTGLSPSDRKTLRAVLNHAGRLPETAIAVSRKDPFAPYFIVATNAARGSDSPVSVQIDGVPETLVGRFKVSIRANVVVKDGLAETPIFRQENGTQYPPGTYRVAVSCKGCEVKAEKTFFLSAGVNDYEMQLKNYHLRLQTQSRDELTELKQVSETLQAQLAETSSEFMKPAARRGDWSKFSAKWATLETQLDSLTSRWTPEAIDGAYFHAPLYTELKHAADATRELHEKQTHALHGHDLSQASEAELIRSAETIRSTLRSLQMRITETANLPLLHGDMPQTSRTTPRTTPRTTSDRFETRDL